MKAGDEKGWLLNQIHSARESMDKWPEWMQKAARFEVEDESSTDSVKATESSVHEVKQVLSEK